MFRRDANEPTVTLLDRDDAGPQSGSPMLHDVCFREPTQVGTPQVVRHASRILHEFSIRKFSTIPWKM